MTSFTPAPVGAVPQPVVTTEQGPRPDLRPEAAPTIPGLGDPAVGQPTTLGGSNPMMGVIVARAISFALTGVLPPLATTAAKMGVETLGQVPSGAAPQTQAELQMQPEAEVSATDFATNTYTEQAPQPIASDPLGAPSGEALETPASGGVANGGAAPQARPQGQPGQGGQAGQGQLGVTTSP